jgi:branched-chain amino acid transport system ATP-binding protein
MARILEADSVVKEFGGLVAVDHVTLSVQEGEIFGLIGPNGAGKTTLLNCLAGSYKPQHGRIRFLGADSTGLRSDILCRRGMARTFQISQPFPRLTVFENVLVAATFGAPPGSVRRPAAYAEEMLAFVDFPLPKETPAQSLNTIQLKRLDLARALASKPRLLLLDELAAGLATGELGDFMAIVRKIRDSGVTIIMVEHIMRVIMGLCDRLAVLHYGVKIAEGDTAEVSRDPQVLEAYLGEKYDL